MVTMSKACEPPIQPRISARDEAHPRIGEYRRYVAAMNVQLVAACSFSNWLRQTEESENGKPPHAFEVRIAPHVRREAPAGYHLADGWYLHTFRRDGSVERRFGPFETRGEAEAAR